MSNWTNWRQQGHGTDVIKPELIPYYEKWKEYTYLSKNIYLDNYDCVASRWFDTSINTGLRSSRALNINFMLVGKSLNMQSFENYFTTSLTTSDYFHTIGEKNSDLENILNNTQLEQSGFSTNIRGTFHTNMGNYDKAFKVLYSSFFIWSMISHPIKNHFIQQLGWYNAISLLSQTYPDGTITDKDLALFNLHPENFINNLKS
jgi:hypothetical protein